jgi:hypothetical protein
VPNRRLRNTSANIWRRIEAKREAMERQRHEDSIEIVRALNKLTTHLVTQTDAERGQENDKVRRDTITLVLVFLTLIATGVGDWFFYGQREEMVRAYEPLQKSARAAEIAANAALKQAIAEDRSSTAGRADAPVRWMKRRF